MFELELEKGRGLVDLLEQLADSTHSTTSNRAERLVAFIRAANDWRANTEEKIIQTLGADPHSRFRYMFQLFADDLKQPGGIINMQLVNSLRSIVGLVENLDDRLKPESFNRPSDWSRPMYCSPLRQRPLELSILWLTRKEVSHATPEMACQHPSHDCA
jgi:hypothetical protein